MMNEALNVAVKAVDDKKAIDVVVLNISEVATFADYFLICSGDSSRQIKAIADEIEEKMSACRIRPSHIEGYGNAEWILMDYADLVVHIFSKQARSYYDLERLWRDARNVDVAGLLEQVKPESKPVRRLRKRQS
jgi:ribosome-associated protein